MAAPRVSIGMPIFNAERYIASALESLLAQSYADYELIISDNASTDDTVEICTSYARQDDRIRVIAQPENRGAIWNFNEVFRQSRSEFFKWASYDDVCEPTLVERCVEVLDEFPDVAWCHSHSAKIGEDGHVLLRDPEARPGYDGFLDTRQAGLPREHHDSTRPGLRFRGVLLGTNWCADSYGLIRASVLSQTRLLPACYGAEKVLMAELALRGKYFQLPQTLFYQRIHGAASSSIGTAAAQQKFMNPGVGRFASTRGSLLKGYVNAIRNTPLTLRERTGCYGALAAYLLQVSKWRAVVTASVRGAGIGRERTKAVSSRAARLAE